MPTFGALKTSVSKRLLDTSNTAVTASDVGDSINAAIRYYKFTRFWFNEAKDSYTLSDGVSTLTPLANVLIPLEEGGLTITHNNIRYDVKKVDSKTFDLNNASGTGMPYIYTYRGGIYEVHYTPDQDYSATFRFLEEYADLSADADTNDFTNNADRLIMYDALSRLHGELRQDEKMEAYYSARAENELQNLLVRTEKQNATGSLTFETI